MGSLMPLGMSEAPGTDFMVATRAHGSNACRHGNLEPRAADSASRRLRTVAKRNFCAVSTTLCGSFLTVIKLPDQLLS